MKTLRKRIVRILMIPTGVYLVMACAFLFLLVVGLPINIRLILIFVFVGGALLGLTVAVFEIDHRRIETGSLGFVERLIISVMRCWLMEQKKKLAREAFIAGYKAGKKVKGGKKT